MKADCSKPEEVKKMFSDISADIGPVSVLVQPNFFLFN
jgi:hypothetical protein